MKGHSLCCKFIFLFILLLSHAASASLPPSNATLEEQQKAMELVSNGLNITIADYKMVLAPSFNFIIKKLPLITYDDDLQNNTDVVKRLAMFRDDLLNIFPRHKVFGYVQNLELCINMGCGNASKSYKRIMMGATPKHFHRRANFKPDASYFLSFREERLADVHEFAHFIDFNENVEDFKKLTWSQDKKGRWKVLKKGINKKKDFLTSYAWQNNAEEDFAEHVGWYVFRRDEFLTRAQQNSVLGDKYEWIKYYIFLNQEFTDDLLKTLFNVTPDPVPPTPTPPPPPTPQPPPPPTSQPPPPVPQPPPPTPTPLSPVPEDPNLVLERTRTQELINLGVAIFAREYTSTKSPFTNFVQPIFQYQGTAQNASYAFQRVSMLYEDLFNIFARDLVLRNVKRIEACINLSCTASNPIGKHMFITATPALFAKKPQDTSFFLVNREERMMDIREFTNILVGSRAINIDSFQAISWQTSKKRHSWLQLKDCVSSSAYANYLRDFTESVSWYVFRRDEFLAKAQNSSALSQKYQWLKTQFFGGQEFTESVLRELFK